MKILKTLLIFVACIAAITVIVSVIGILFSQSLAVEKYIEPFDGIQCDVKIVFLSDLHGKEFDENNTKVAELIKAQKPDIIAVVGDLIDRNSDAEDVEKMCSFMSTLPSIAPTYFTIGNHETSYMTENGDNILDKIRDSGVTVLECEYEDLTVNGTTFRFGGMSELAYYGGDGKYDPKAEPFLKEYCDTDLPKIMLSHRPEAFGFRYACKSWDFDLVLSGHTHGGLVRLPKIGGLFAPIQGVFPKFYYGEYQFYDSKMIITSGLAGYEGFPRMFNPPEIAVVTLTAKG